MEHPGNENAALAQQVGVAHVAGLPVFQRTGFRIHVANAQALADVRHACEADEVAHGAERVPAVPRAEKGAESTP